MQIGPPRVVLTICKTIIITSILVDLGLGAYFAFAQHKYNQEHQAQKTVAKVSAQSHVLGLTDANSLTEAGLGGISQIPSSLNKLSNSSFEAGTLGAEPKAWGYTGAAGSTNTQVSNFSVRSGSLALRVNDSGASKNNKLTLGVSQPRNTTINGRKYILSVYLRTVDLAGSPKLRLGFQGGQQVGQEHGGKDAFQTSSLSLSNTSSWKNFTFEYPNAALGKYPSLELVDYAGGTVFLDDATLYEIGSSSGAPAVYQSVTSIGDGALAVDASGNLYLQSGYSGTLGLEGSPWTYLYGQKGNFSSDVSVGGQFAASGAVNLAGSLKVNGETTFGGPVNISSFTVSGSTSFVDLTASGNADIAGSLMAGSSNGFTVNSSGNLTAINGVAYSWPSSQGAATSILQNNGSGTLSWATLGAASITPDSLDFTEFKDAMTLDASTDIGVTGSNVFSITNTGTGNSFLVNDQAADTSPFVIDASGNVGIGTSSPGYALTVSTGTTSLASGTWLQFGSAATLYGDGSSTTIDAPNSGGTFKINTEGSEKFRITSTGLMGLGATTPLGLFHSKVAATAVTATTYNGYFENLATNSTTDAIDKYGMYITSTGTYTGSSGTATNNYGLYVASPTGADNNYAAVFAGGNIGIGTATPQNQLDIYKAGTSIMSLTGNNGGSGENAVGKFVLRNDLTSSGTKDLASINLLVNTTNSINFGDLAFYTKNGASDSSLTERMRILNGGNVGIGTATPGSLLGLGSSVNQTQGKLNIYDDGTYISGFGAYSNETLRLFGDATNKLITFGYMTRAGTFTEGMRLTNGKLGVGTTSPTGRLQSTISSSAVTATTYNGYFENLATNSTTDAVDKYGLYVTSTGTYTGSSGTATNNYGLYVAAPTGADNNYGAIIAGGKVGIGTTAPTGLLSVTGTSLNGAGTFLSLTDNIDNSDANYPAKISFVDNNGNAGNHMRKGFQVDFSGTSTFNDRSIAALITNSLVGSQAITFGDAETGNNALQVKTTGSTTGGNRAGMFMASGGATNVGAEVIASGTATTNIAGYFSASGGTSNYALVVPSTGGNVGIGTTTPGVALDVSAAVTTSTRLTATNNTSYVVYSARAGTTPTNTYLFNFAPGYSSTGGYSASGGALEADGSGGLSVAASNASGALRFYTGGIATGNQRVTVDSTGNFGIGDTTPAALLTVGNTDLFQVNSSGVIAAAAGLTTSGTVTFSSITSCTTGLQTSVSGVVSCISSDERLKTNIQQIQDPLAALTQLRGVTYNWKDPVSQSEGIQYGFIAQDVEKVVPGLTFTMGDGIKGVKYQQMVGLVVEGIKQQQLQIETLQSQLAGSGSSTLVATSSASLNQIVGLNYSLQDDELTVTKVIRFTKELFVDAAATFSKPVKFLSDVVFHGKVKFGNDVTFASNSGGEAVILPGADKVDVAFSQEFRTTPVVTASLAFHSSEPAEMVKNAQEKAASYVITNVSTKGFTIVLKENAATELHYNWLALQVAESSPTVSSVTATTPTPKPTPTQQTVLGADTQADATPSATPSSTPIPSPTIVSTASASTSSSAGIQP